MRAHDIESVVIPEMMSAHRGGKNNLAIVVASKSRHPGGIQREIPMKGRRCFFFLERVTLTRFTDYNKKNGNSFFF